MEPDKYILGIEFEGILDDSLRGFYRTKHTVHGEVYYYMYVVCSKPFQAQLEKFLPKIFTTNHLCCFPFPFFCPPTYIFRSFCLFSSLFFNFQYLRKRYETKVVGNVSSYCSKPFFILMKSKKRKKIGPFYMYFLQEYYTKYACKKALIPLFFRFHQNKKKLGTVT